MALEVCEIGPLDIGYPPSEEELKVLREAAQLSSSRRHISPNEGRVNVTPPNIDDTTYELESNYGKGGTVYIRRQSSLIGMARDYLRSLRGKTIPSNIEIIHIPSNIDIVPVGKQYPESPLVESDEIAPMPLGTRIIASRVIRSNDNSSNFIAAHTPSAHAINH